MKNNNVNVLVIPSCCVENGQLIGIIRAWLQATFLGGRYRERLDMLDS